MALSSAGRLSRRIAARKLTHYQPMAFRGRCRPESVQGPFGAPGSDSGSTGGSSATCGVRVRTPSRKNGYSGSIGGRPTRSQCLRIGHSAHCGRRAMQMRRP